MIERFYTTADMRDIIGDRTITELWTWWRAHDCDYQLTSEEGQDGRARNGFRVTFPSLDVEMLMKLTWYV